MVKKQKGKNWNDSRIALNRPTRQAETSAHIYTFKKKKKTKSVIHRSVCSTRTWKNTLQGRGKERLKKLPCEISAIRLIGNSAAINFCARRSYSRASMKHSHLICACIQMWKRKDHAKPLSLSLKRQKQSTEVQISV